LLGISREEVQANPENNATLAAVVTDCVVLLKGNTSYIASPEGELREISELSAALATAGTGDVLAGILGALLAANSEAASENAFMDIIELAVRIHSAAAELAAIAGPVSALDVAESVRNVIAELI
jgi:NAD(P)H-hydrate repair Nnr-like enzyme with NAD(P)H-hydrate dehydratase domain